MIAPDNCITLYRNPSYRAGSLITWFALLGCMLATLAVANVVRADTRLNSLDDPNDPSNLLPRIEEKRIQKDSLFPASPLGWLHESTDQAEQDLYDAIDADKWKVLDAD